MATQDFDTTIIRPTERPLSSDINALQGQLNRAIRDLAASQYEYENGGVRAHADGFIGYAFKAQSAGAGVVGVDLIPGVGFQYNDVDDPTDIYGVSGLSDLSAYKPLILSSARRFTTTSATSGNCRRDRLMVRYNRNAMDTSSRYFLTGSPPTFQSQNVDKTMTFDLANSAVASVAYLNATDPVPVYGPAFVYRAGVETAYTDEDSFLTAAIPSEDFGYLTIAVINMGAGVTEIATNRIVDYRKLLLPNGCASLSASVRFTEEMATFSNLKSAVPPSWRVVAIKNDGTPTQRADVYFFIGDTDSLTVATTGTHIQPLVGSLPTFSVMDYSYFVQSSTVSYVTDTLRNVINGTTSGYTVLGGFDVAVGAKYLELSGLCGTLAPRVSALNTEGEFVFDAQTLALAPLAYTFNFNANVQRTA